MENDKRLEDLLSSNTISQKTYEKVTITKNYIEQKYNLKTIKNLEFNDIISKIKELKISESEKEKIKEKLYKRELKKSLKKKFVKQTIYNYKSLSIIGRGAFGEVHICKEIKSNKIVAIKKINKEKIELKNQLIHIRNEQLFMSKVKNPWIVELKESFQEGNYLYLVMEFLGGGDLMGLLIRKDILSEEEAKFYVAEIILAIESLHKLNCIHRDIKPDNILISNNGHIKLSDFGLTKVSDELFYINKNNNYINNNKLLEEKKEELKHEKNYSCVGTAYYVAPEVLNKKGYGKEIDWWSVGVIFFEMLYGYAPFCSKETNEVCYKVLNWEKFLVFPKKIKISVEAEDLIRKLINNNNVRLGKNGPDEIKKHSFFKNFDWDNIFKLKPPFIPNLKCDYDCKYFEEFNYEEPFYPNEINLRKNANFIGYTYKSSFDEELSLKEEFNNIIKEINLKRNKSFSGEINYSQTDINLNDKGIFKKIKIKKNESENNSSRNSKFNIITTKRIVINCDNEKRKNLKRNINYNSPCRTIYNKGIIKQKKNLNTLRFSPSPNKIIYLKYINFPKNKIIRFNNSSDKKKKSPIPLIRQRMHLGNNGYSNSHKVILMNK